MIKGFWKIQVSFGTWVLLYIGALYAATGVGMGFKLDDNQLLGYILCLISVVLLVASCFLRQASQQVLFAGLLTGLSLLLLASIVFNWISFNGAFWYFILFTLVVPWMVVGYGLGFIVRSKKQLQKEKFKI